jgi:hypothetical protein
LISSGSAEDEYEDVDAAAGTVSTCSASEVECQGIVIIKIIRRRKAELEICCQAWRASEFEKGSCCCCGEWCCGSSFGYDCNART